MKVTRANEYWGIPDETPRRTAAPLTRSEIEDLMGGPRIYAGMLHFADDDKSAAEVDDPSSTPGLLPRMVPELKRLEHNLGNEGGSSANDGSPERWPIILPGDKLMNAAEDVADMGMDVLQSKLPTKAASRRRRYAAAPDPYDLQPTGKYLGTHGAEVHNGPDAQWLVKPPRDDEHWPAALDTATAQLQQRAGLPTPEIHSVNMNGVPTPVHKMIPGARDAFPGKQFDHKSLSDDDIMTLQKHNVLDWMLSNHDAHPGQFIREPSTGQLIGIDKGQAFRYFGKDSLDPGFHPNEMYGEREPIYNTMWRNFSRGQGHMNDPRTGELGQFIQNLQGMPDEEFQQTLRPYAEQAAAVGKLGGGGGAYGPMLAQGLRPNDPDSFLEHATARKNSLLNDFGNYYDQMAGNQRQFISRRAYRY